MGATSGASFFLSSKHSRMDFLLVMSSAMGAGMWAGMFSLPKISKSSFFAGESPILRFSMAEDACIGRVNIV